MQQTQQIIVSWIPEMYLGESVDIVVTTPVELFNDYTDLTFSLEHAEGVLTPNGSLKEVGSRLEKKELITGITHDPVLRIPLSVTAQTATQKKHLRLMVESVDIMQRKRYSAELELTILRDPTQLNVHVGGNMMGSNVLNDNEGSRVQARERSLALRNISSEAINPLVEGNFLFQRRYQLVESLGAGGFGSVWLAQMVGQSGRKAVVALKFITMSSAKNPREQEMLEREADKLELLRHENIIAFRGLEHEANLWALAQEYASEGSLDLQLQQQKRGYFTTEEIRPWIEQIVEGLQYLHSKKILHRDIKPHNILINAEGIVKISDFGLSSGLKNTLSRLSKDLGQGHETTGTLAYTAPQILLRSGSYSEQEDLYSLGILIYELLTGRTPFDDAPTDDLLYYYIKNEDVSMPTMLEIGRESYDDYPEPDECWVELVEGLTAYQRADRIKSASDALKVLSGESPKQHKKQAEAEQREQEQRKQLEQEQARKQQQEENQLKKEQRKLGKKTKGWGIGLVLQKIANTQKCKEEKQKEEKEEHERLAKLEQKLEKQKLVGSKAGERRVFEVASGVEIAFRWCPPTGTEGFLMGSPKDEIGRDNNETQHKVILTKGFWMAETEFTQGHWQKSMNNNPSHCKNVGKNAPVEKVSWNDVQELLKKLNASGRLPKGMKLTLPTEAQWEYACRAGTSTPFHYGFKLRSSQANFFYRDYSYPVGATGAYKNDTTPVKSFNPNAWGLYDMHGNVWEWCSDWYGEYGEEAKTNPTGASRGDYCSLRGGCCDSDADVCRSAYRRMFAPSSLDYNFGFRLVLQVPEN